MSAAREERRGCGVGREQAGNGGSSAGAWSA